MKASKVKEATKKNPVSTKIRYKYIPRRIHGITNKNHVLYDGKLDSAIDKFSVLRDTSGRFVLNLTEDEKEFIKQGLGLSDADLNVHNGNNEYLRNFKVEMPKHGIHLDVSRPYDLLVDKVLQAYNNIIAPNSKDIKKKASYRYVRVSQSDEVQMSIEEFDTKKKAYKILGTLETSREKMLIYLANTSMRVSPSIDNLELRKLVNESADRNLNNFIRIVEDPLFVEKGIIRLGSILNVIDVKSGLYYYENLPLAFEGQIANLNNAAAYIKDKEQANLKLTLSEKILNEFKRT